MLIDFTCEGKTRADKLIAMPKLTPGLITFAVICASAFYGIHLWRNYQGIENKSSKLRAVSVRPDIDSGSVSEIGYIFDVRRENHIRDGYRNLVWFIAVPGSGGRFSCQYVSGVDDFQVGDGVTFIHNTAHSDEGEYGYIVGLHDKRKGKVTLVSTNDLDDIEFDSDDQ